jgi:hypothetical protein
MVNELKLSKTGVLQLNRVTYLMLLNVLSLDIYRPDWLSQCDCCLSFSRLCCQQPGLRYKPDAVQCSVTLCKLASLAPYVRTTQGNLSKLYSLCLTSYFHLLIVSVKL